MSNNDDLVFHWFPGACARVTLISLEEIGVPYERRLFRRFEPEAVKAYRRDVNPKGKVPALVAGGRLITENPAVQTYLDRRFPEANLLPKDPDVWLDALSMMCWFSAGIHPEVGRSRVPSAFTDAPEGYDGIQAKARDQLRFSFAQLEQRLQDREWLFGDWTIVDGYMLWLWFRAVGSGLTPEEFPNVHASASACQERPAVARVLDMEEQALADLAAEGKAPKQAADQGGRIPVAA